MPEPAIAPSATALAPDVLEFLRTPHRYAVLATIDPDGRPRQVLTWYRLVDDTIVLNSLVGRRWPTNLLRDPRITITVSDGHDWVSVDGRAEPVEDQAIAQGDIAAMAHAYDSPDDAATEIARFRTQQRISFRVIPERTHVEIGD
jgi:PPOX class probable F420-dependent enzyme